MNRGERVANRTRTAIKQALLELIHENNYPEITVNQITQAADVGRSTFYRHYQSKADVLVEIHKDMFDHLFNAQLSLKNWIQSEPPFVWVSFLDKYKRLGRNPFSLSYKLGNDLDYLVTRINGQLTITVENWLRQMYSDEDCRIPLTILAQAISASFSGLVMSWFSKFQNYNAELFISYIHGIIGAQIREALNQ